MRQRPDIFEELERYRQEHGHISYGKFVPIYEAMYGRNSSTIRNSQIRRISTKCELWTKDDNETLLEMYREGASDVEIAAELHRSKKAVAVRRGKLLKNV